MCRLWAIASGMPAENAETPPALFALIGQVVYFRLAREVVRRRLTWNKAGRAETGQIASVIETNLAAILDHHTEKNRNPAP